MQPDPNRANDAGSMAAPANSRPVRPTAFRLDLLAEIRDRSAETQMPDAVTLSVPESVSDLAACTALFGPFEPAFIRICIAKVPIEKRYGFTFSDVKLSGSLLHRHPKLPTQRRVARAILIEQEGVANFGTWLLDILPGIAAALKAVDQQATPIDIIVPRRCSALGQKFHPLISALDSRLRLLVPQDGEVLQIDEAIVPPPLRQDHLVSPHAASFFEHVQHAAARCAPDANDLGERVFLSRRYWKNQRRLLVNRSRIEALMTEHGFVQIVPERIELAQLIAGLRSVAVLAGEDGSALHIGAFSPASTILSLVGDTRSEDRSPFTTSGVCAMRRSRSILIAGNRAPAFDLSRQAPFLVSETLTGNVLGCL